MRTRLMKRYADLRKKDGGFTLIELLIVIVILGVLAGVVVFAVSGISDRGDSAACKAEKKTVEVAVEAYYAKNGSYPLTLAVLQAAPDKFLNGPLSKATFTAGTATTAPTIGPATC
jgi:general secretion pathway protein G